ncbi:hypothetical protein ABPG74_006053 [Tetrahymena malaccensis]
MNSTNNKKMNQKNNKKNKNIQKQNDKQERLLLMIKIYFKQQGQQFIYLPTDQLKCYYFSYQIKRQLYNISSFYISSVFLFILYLSLQLILFILVFQISIILSQNIQHNFSLVYFFLSSTNVTQQIKYLFHRKQIYLHNFYLILQS